MADLAGDIVRAFVAATVDDDADPDTGSEEQGQQWAPPPRQSEAPFAHRRRSAIVDKMYSQLEGTLDAVDEREALERQVVGADDLATLAQDQTRSPDPDPRRCL